MPPDPIADVTRQVDLGGERYVVEHRALECYFTSQHFQEAKPFLRKALLQQQTDTAVNDSNVRVDSDAVVVHHQARMIDKARFLPLDRALVAC